MALRRGKWSPFDLQMKNKQTKLSGSIVKDTVSGATVSQFEMAKNSNCNILWTIARLLGAL